MTSTPRWKLALFDLDGTLVNSIELIVVSYQHTFSTVLGRELTREEILPWIGRTLLDVMSVEAPGRETELEEAYLRYNHAIHDEMVSACDGMPELLADLADAGIATAVVTAKRSGLAEQGLRVTGYPDSIHVSVGMADTVEHKPHPAPLLAGLEKNNTSPEDAVYIGDAVYDLQAASRVPMAGIGVTWGAGNRDALLAQPSIDVVDTADQLRALLLG